MRGMTSPAPDKCWGIGDVARRTGVTERTLRYYEELGLLAPVRGAGGRRRYDGRTLDRLYRIRLFRSWAPLWPTSTPMQTTCES
ncbi:hypothetical protein NPS01_17760 [Nocardioides psychrotolerans]|uniref:MerR family regulatory protein n=2 Tax=Nocardioides psychrotolerans TaxID=1005945 RepID=A0A1I3IRY5_9ACTN|nr:hypothetical protein NPS01_17760 [Nocardioides psychrotolerans]SFI50746.1 MerR family regulatory protein [Nocardioides psychrotolerans]